MNKSNTILFLFFMLMACDKEKIPSPLRSNPIDINNPDYTGRPNGYDNSEDLNTTNDTTANDGSDSNETGDVRITGEIEEDETGDIQIIGEIEEDETG